ncbi:long-chain fatty acid--CoA ligase [Oxalobacteraceae bacterium OM1]|nr:long-chain fatty acid--CoA ligase [Oxalobacteraceae bacterium OM1]
MNDTGAKPSRTLPELFDRRVRLSPAAEAYREYDLAGGRWVSTTWQEMAGSVDAWSRALDAVGLERGARVAVLLPNSVNYVCIDQAVLRRAMVPVPMHAIDNPASIAYILSDAQAGLLVLSNAAQWEAVAAAGYIPESLKMVVVTGNEAVRRAEHAPGVAVMALKDWLVQGAGQPHAEPAPPGTEDLAGIVYTSGTMGRPKGVMLTHGNIVANIEAVLELVPARENDVFLSFLPLSHTFERTIGYYLPIATGSCVAYARSVADIPEDLKTVRPTVLVSVPRIYERFYAKLQETLAASGAVTRAMFRLAEEVGWRRFCRRQGMPVEGKRSAPLDDLLWSMLEPLVARKLLAQFGGRLYVAVSGGAPISSAVTRCFVGLGLPLLQGYGMTETSPVVAANSLQDNWPATVGRALRGVEVRTGENNELQVRGPSVMRGYWNRPEDTQRTMTADGWLRTGDQAAIDAGRIRIVGRIKEIIVTSTGEKIAPADLELAITSDPLFEQAMVIGEDRPFIGAFVVLARHAWKELAASLGIDPESPASLESDAARGAALERIQTATQHFPRYAVPKAVRLTLEPWTIESGLITPTLKLKRNALQTRLGERIAGMYARR